ncbi:MAG: SDR family NAD(P)-dependent oxidoreductase [Gammaproteobacteria bacterium]
MVDFTGRLAGKVAIVTGAGRGVGRGIARAFGAAGAQVAVTSRNPQRVQQVTAEIVDAGGTAIGIPCDVGERAQVFAAIEQAAQAFGGIDILVNNAQGFGTPDIAVNHPVWTPLEDFNEAEWEYTFRTGVTATMWAMKAAFAHLRRRGRGKVINFGSFYGQLGLEGGSAYNANKEAIRALSRTAAREWGRYGINVNVINPLIRASGMDDMLASDPAQVDAMRMTIPMRRIGEAFEDAGALAIFLAGPESDYITGMTFMLDGGNTMYP